MAPISLKSLLPGALRCGRARRVSPKPGLPEALGPEDRLSILIHFAQLSAEERQRRFWSVLSLPVLAARYMAADFGEAAFFGSFAGSRLVGLAELRPLPRGRTELALSVHGRWQGRGVGRALLARAIAEVAGRQGRRLILVTERRNGAMIRLARAMGGRLEPAGDEVTITFLPHSSRNARVK